LKAKPEVGVQFGAGGASTAGELKAEGTRDARWAVALARRFLEAGAHMIMVESEGITENAETWRNEPLIDHSQIVRLEALRAGLGGTKSLYAGLEALSQTPDHCGSLRIRVANAILSQE
jgi:phosphosulfolactate synthase (CoM biosynthesis protein A)